MVEKGFTDLNNEIGEYMVEGHISALFEKLRDTDELQFPEETLAFEFPEETWSELLDELQGSRPIYNYTTHSAHGTYYHYFDRQKHLFITLTEQHYDINGQEPTLFICRLNYLSEEDYNRFIVNQDLDGLELKMLQIREAKELA